MSAEAWRAGLGCLIVGFPIGSALMAVSSELDSRHSHEIVTQLEQAGAPTPVIEAEQARGDNSHDLAKLGGAVALLWTAGFGGMYLSGHTIFNPKNRPN